MTSQTTGRARSDKVSASAAKWRGGWFSGAIRLLAFMALLGWGGSMRVKAFVFITSPATVWPAGNIPMNLQLGGILDQPLKDGSASFDAVATNALALWNRHLTTVKFTASTDSEPLPENGDNINQVFFDTTIYGFSFGDDILAVTTRWSIGKRRVESDVIFNSNVPWDSYRGRLRQTGTGGGALYDFQRAALHEFGHSLGLDHPDEAGQNVAALMNSFISDLDHLSPDDIQGASALYGGAPSILEEPQSQFVTAGSSVEFTVLATGLLPLRYQWFFKGGAIDAATNSIYSIERVQSSQAGTYTVTVSNGFGSVQSAPATLAIDEGTAFGIVGVPFRYQITADNNPIWYSASGLPPGIIYDGRSGAISGTPTRTGTFSVEVTARNLFVSSSSTIAFTIAEGAITSATNVEGIVGVPFVYAIGADNLPTWHSASGLPAGLIYSGTSGLIAGTPTREGSFEVPVTARNFFGSASGVISFRIDEGSITSATNIDGVIGVPLVYQIVANNNPTWYAVSGLPSGLIYNGVTGLISGTPRRTGTSAVEVTARNSFGATSSTIFLTINDEKVATGTSPLLTVTRTSDSFLLKWPRSSEGLVLEETHLESNGWINSPAKVVIQGYQSMAVITTNRGATFYRLRK